MLNIYEYSHDSISCITLAYLVAAEQPLAGGANADESAHIIKHVHQVASIDEARAWIERAIPEAMQRFTFGDYSVIEKPHSQAILCIAAESAGYDDDEEFDA